MILIEEGALHNKYIIRPVPLPTNEPAWPAFKIGATIENKYTGARKTIERTQIVDVAQHLVYITTDGTRYNGESLNNHWTPVDEQEVK